MKRLAFALILILLAGMTVVAQEHSQPAATGAHTAAEAGEHGGEHAESDGLSIWKWANFALLAGVLGWMLRKAAPEFFRSRTEQIQRGIADATRMKQDAEARAAKMEMRMASLQSEIEQVRAEAHVEMVKETDRIRREAEQHMARIQAHSEQEISALTKHAEQRLREYASQLAVELAEQRIRSRMNAEAQNTLFAGFVRQLDLRDASGEVRQ